MAFGVALAMLFSAAGLELYLFLAGCVPIAYWGDLWSRPGSRAVAATVWGLHSGFGGLRLVEWHELRSIKPVDGGFEIQTTAGPLFLSLTQMGAKEIAGVVRRVVGGAPTSTGFVEWPPR